MIILGRVRKIEDGQRALSYKIRLSNSNNSQGRYYDLSIVTYLGGCYRLQLLCPLLFFLLVPLLQLHVPPVSLRAAFALIHSAHAPDYGYPLHRYQQAQLNSRHKGQRIRPTTCGPHIVNLPLVMTANRLGPYLVITNRWAGKSAPIPYCKQLRLVSIGHWVNSCYNWNK